MPGSFKKLKLIEKSYYMKCFLAKIMVGNEATTTSHPNQIRVLEDGHGTSDLSKRAMRAVETGRPLSTVEIPENGRPLRTAAERMMEPELNESDIWQLPDHTNSSASNQRKLMKIENRKRKFSSEPVELSGLPRHSIRFSKARFKSEVYYYFNVEYLFILSLLSF
ncbi:uncharacterized protein LOC134211529 [Armigeres subalbatus]|uniref:uncharacterized protein LOC134211529 n=1 Tax=Armigeres subalbatus TaxID=124917 RepID=UPI002ED33759